MHPTSPPAPGPPPSDEDLVRVINTGRPAEAERAFEALYRRHRDWAVRVARRFTNDDALALDAMQETFAYLLTKFPGFELRAKMTTFLYPAVRNIALGLARKRRREPALGDRLPDRPAASDAPAPGVGEDDPKRALARLLAALPDAQREAVLLRFVDGMSMIEIAAATGVPVGTVKSRLHHAVRALREDPAVRRHYGLDEGSVNPTAPSGAAPEDR